MKSLKQNSTTATGFQEVYPYQFFLELPVPRYQVRSSPSSWGDDYKTCLGKFQSPIDIREKDVTTVSFTQLEFSNVNNSHTAYMTNNGHTVMIQSFDPNAPLISGGPINDTYVFQQLHFHWGQNDNLGSEDLINNHSFSMELHAVFWKKDYGSSEAALKHDDGLTVLGYLYQATDKSNPVFDSITWQIPDITGVGSNITINDTSVLSKLIAPDLASAQNYFTYRGSLTTPPCLEIVQWIDFVQPQYISHEQLAAFRIIQSTDGTNLTHNFRPVQPLDGRIVYRNNVTTESTSASSTVMSGTVSTTTVSKQTTSSTAKATKESEATTITVPEQSNSENSMDTFVVMLGIIFLLPHQ
ncbi:Carbonic anhydrase [Eufriesea mexicana]|uniref:Carbonic anhydrase n=1 Tax=Eufriesea mexicana TaxID=516756 RepID=A0A310S7N9_9HYME|nr:Carbonic anhydrase [Eufriesea mexicana]